MALAEIIAFIFVFGIAGFLLKKGMDEKTFTWSFIGSMLFLGTTLYGFQVPFVVDASGATIPGASNIMLASVSLIAMTIGLFITVKQAMLLMAQKSTTRGI